MRRESAVRRVLLSVLGAGIFSAISANPRRSLRFSCFSPQSPLRNTA